MEKFTPEYAEAISGVDRELIIQAARHVRQRQKRRHLLGAGHPGTLPRHRQCPGLINLALLTGHIGRQGTGLNPLRGQNNVQGASDSGAMPWHYPGYQRVDNEDCRRANSKGLEYRTRRVEPQTLA